MKRPPTFLHNFFWRGGAVLGFMLAGTADAHAYVDPGTGAMGGRGVTGKKAAP